MPVGWVARDNHGNSPGRIAVWSKGDGRARDILPAYRSDRDAVS